MEGSSTPSDGFARDQIGWKHIFPTCSDHGGRVPVRLRHRVEGQHNDWDLIDPARYRGTVVVQICTEHVVHGVVAYLIDGIAFLMVRGGEHPLDS